MKLTIQLPEDLAADIIARAAKLRRNKQRQAIRQAQHAAGAIDENLSDEDFLAADIKASLIADYKQVVAAEAAQNASKKAAAEIDEKLKGK